MMFLQFACIRTPSGLKPLRRYGQKPRTVFVDETGSLKSRSHGLTSHNLSTCWCLCVGVYEGNRLGFEVVVL